jgi:hypothetical protein
MTAIAPSAMTAFRSSRDSGWAGHAAAGHAALEELRVRAEAPTDRPEVKRMIGSATRAHPEVFAREILPAIQSVPLSKVAAATGLSIQHCGMVRRGLRVPHPRHWEAMRSLNEPSR